jgi:glycosyltransferase involved in cell wall biosynthesis
LRILHVVYIPRYSGAEILVRDMSLIHARDGQAVGVCSLFPPEIDFLFEMNRMKEAGIVWMTPESSMGRFERIRSLRRWLRQFKPDVIVAHADIPSAYVRLATIAGNRAPIISVLHHAAENEYSSGLGKKLEKLLTYRAAAIVTVSTRAADNYRRNVRTHPLMRVILNGVRIDEFIRANESRETHRRTLGLSADDLLILQVGRLSEIKRQHLSVEAFAKITAEFPTLKFWMAGIYESGDIVNNIENLIRSRQLNDRVKLLGARSDIPELLAACDLYVMPSAHEAHSVAMLEALASGAPIIASNISAFSYVSSQPGVTLLDPTDTTNFANEIRRNIKERVRYPRNLGEFSIDGTAQAYVDLFRELIGKEEN